MEEVTSPSEMAAQKLLAKKALNPKANSGKLATKLRHGETEKPKHNHQNGSHKHDESDSDSGDEEEKRFLDSANLGEKLAKAARDKRNSMPSCCGSDSTEEEKEPEKVRGGLEFIIGL